MFKYRFSPTRQDVGSSADVRFPSPKADTDDIVIIVFISSRAAVPKLCTAVPLGHRNHFLGAPRPIKNKKLVSTFYLHPL